MYGQVFFSQAKHKTAQKKKQQKWTVLCAVATKKDMAGVDLEIVHSRGRDFVPGEQTVRQLLEGTGEGLETMYRVRLCVLHRNRLAIRYIFFI